MDGMSPISFAELRARLEECGVIESHPPHTESQIPEVHFFTRMVMGVGSPYSPVLAKSDDSLVYPPTVVHLLHTLGVSPVQFWQAIVTEETGDDQRKQ